ncbi:xanthine dehydrogenase accessory protein XdhC [Kribbella sp. DT2]|uniref:xanthine dehydrogenase accessory protein XdhC n=1 Tax=Kribbella sp. DT2 TaxID=3393427 RepID=UPI003CF6207F
MRAVQRLREQRLPGVLVTVVSVRGHSPREAGAKMVVGAERTWATVGGGNLEMVAVDRARAMIAEQVTAPEVLEFKLSDKAPYQQAVQCCGGEMKLLLEPLAVVPSLAIFGLGHVGLELARIMARHDIELHLIDSRPDQLTTERLAVLDDAVAGVHIHQVPVLPELVVGELPPGTHALVMTHDHAEDAALCDAALRNGQLATIGLIGSSAKWARFQRKLAEDGIPSEAIATITTPIGLPDLPGKEPATIAVSVAAWLLHQFIAERHQAPAHREATA